MKSKRYKNEATATKSEHDRNVRLHIEHWAYDIWEVEVCHHGEQIARRLRVEMEVSNKVVEPLRSDFLWSF